MRGWLAASCMALLMLSSCGDDENARPTQPVESMESAGTVTEALVTEFTFVDTMLSAAVAGASAQGAHALRPLLGSH